jgi:ABC-2 type transport system permease protein
VRDPGIDVRRTMLFNPALADRVFFLPTLPAIFFTQLFFGLACFSIVGERERGTYEHVLALPLRPSAVLLGKAMPYAALAGLWLVAYYAFVATTFGLEVRGGAGVLALATAIFVAASYAIAVLFSAVARTTDQAVYLTVFSVLPSTVISGFLAPTSTMPRAIQLASLALPATHYVSILRAVVVRGARLADVAVPLAALATILLVVAGCLFAWYPRRLDR